MWVEIDGSPRFRERDSGGAELVRTFTTDVGQGVANAAAHGYVRGAEITHEGTTGIWYNLTLLDVAVSNSAGADKVVVTYVTISISPRGRASHPEYNDGKLRKAGDSEWHIEANLEQLPAELASAHNGETYQEAWNVGHTDLVKQPGAVLVWRHWLDKAVEGEDLHTLPITQAEALDAVQTYLPGSGGDYEDDGPRVMHRLSATGLAAKFLCSSVELEEDGDLVCRIAKFIWNANGWNTHLYA